MLLVCLLQAGCAGDPPDDERRLLDDRTASLELAAIRRSLSGPAPLSPQEFQSLSALRERFPDATLVRDTYQAALIRRGDWQALLDWLLAIPEAARTAADQRNLVNVHYKLGRFDEALAAADRLDADAAANPETVEVVANSLFRLGRLDEAAQHLDQHRKALLQARRSAALGLRGLIHLQLGEDEAAEKALKTALGIDPSDRASMLALARLHHRAGRADEAQLLLERAEAIQGEATRRQTNAMRLVELVQAVKEHWSRQQHAEVVRSARQALPFADDATKATLYEYIAESSERLGRSEDARAARAERARLTE